uniref:Uncharacterized protein n=1 Tax=Tanacetum cinerariifolium TaxID=118510 RepID=A0A6L2M3Z2_TANCI|nr:hypothetical protein [Tanacetum cinerariifolium]
MLMVEDNVGNQFRPNAVQNDKNQYGNRNVVTAPAEGNGNGIRGNGMCLFQQQLQITQEEEAGIQSTQEEFEFMAAANAYEETERTDQLRHLSENCYDNDIFNMFTQEEQYTELLESIPEPHQVPHNDSNVISEVSSVEQGGRTVEHYPANFEKTSVLYDSLYNNLAIEVEKVNLVNRKLRETNADLTTELARYKNREKCFEISQEKYDKLERCYQKSVYQEQRLTKKINALHLSSAKFVREFKSLAKEADESLAKHKALELEIERLLRAVVSQDIMSIVQNNYVVDTSNLQTELEHTFDPLPRKLENENVELEFQVRNYEKENAHLKTAYKNQFDFINVTRAQTKLHDTIDEIAKLRAQLFDKVSEQKDTTKGTSVNTLFCKQSILEKPTSSGSKLYSVTPFPKSSVLLKVDMTNALSKLVTSNLAPSTPESKGMQTVNVIAPRIFRTNPSKTSRVDNVFPNKPVKASVRTKPITVSQPHVITTDNQCLTTVNHDVSVLNYVNGMNSHGKKQKANGSNIENQKKHKAQVWKPKNVWSKERLASPKPSTPRSCLRWSPTGRTFDLKGKIITTSKSVCQYDCSKGDNACASNPQEPISRRFPNSTFSMTGDQNWFDSLLIPLLF